MVNSKKLLSLFLAVVMVFSVLSVMVSALNYTKGPEGSADIDIKYSVEKVDVIPETEAGSAELAGDNFYAVTVWMKSAKPVDTIVAPFHYNKTLFAPITLSDGECTYPYGAGLDQDTYYSDMGEGTNYLYTLGDYMNNTGMYKADGTKAASKALAKCIGIGNSNADPVKVTTELVSPDHPLYGSWGKGLSADTGVVYAKVSVTANTKTAYLNTIEGIATSTDWNRMITVYFEAIAGDVAGAEFGVSTDDCFGVDGNYDGKGLGYFQGVTNYQGLVPTMNVVENAVLAAAPASPVYHVKNQIQWANAEKDTVNLGVVAGFDIADIKPTFNENGTSDNIENVGAVVTIGDGAAATNFERYVYVANDGDSYYFRAVITGIPADYIGGDIVVTPFVWMDGEETPIYGEAVTITAADVEAYVAKLPQ